MKRWMGLALAGEILVGGVWALPASAAQSTAGEFAQTIGPVSVLQVRPDVYMLTMNGANVAVATGPEGTVVVNTGPASASDALLAAIKQLTSTPIRVVIDTSADADLIGGNEAVAAAGQALTDVLFRPGGINSGDVGKVAAIIARQSVLERIVSQPGPAVPTWALPGEVFTRPQYNLYLNGQGIEVIWQPAAHSDGDSVVLFRRSDVVVTGAIFDITRFPVIDLEHGGSIQGEIDALNRVMNTLVIAPTPVVTNEGGTMIIPLRGQLCSQSDLLAYRDMVAAVRDRIQDQIAHGKTLAQTKAADPAQGYRSRYGTDTGRTTDEFVEAVYKSLMAQSKAHKHASTQGGG